MEAKVIKIDIEGNEIDSADELKKKIAEKIAEAVGDNIAEAIAEAVEADLGSEDVQDHDRIAELANKSWNKNQRAIQMALKMTNKRSELSAAEIAEILFTTGFLEGYLTKEKECEKCE